jgi:hypothetical protein
MNLSLLSTKMDATKNLTEITFSTIETRLEQLAASLNEITTTKLPGEASYPKSLATHNRTEITT